MVASMIPPPLKGNTWYLRRPHHHLKETHGIFYKPLPPPPPLRPPARERNVKKGKELFLSKRNSYPKLTSHRQ